MQQGPSLKRRVRNEHHCERKVVARGGILSFLHPMKQMKVGFWDVRTMHVTGKAAQMNSEMRGYELQILDISKSTWNRSGRVRLLTGESNFLWARWQNDILSLHQQRVAIMPERSAKSPKSVTSKY